MKDYRGEVTYTVRREPPWGGDARTQARIDRELARAGTVPTFRFAEACLILDAAWNTAFSDVMGEDWYRGAGYKLYAVVQEASAEEDLGTKWGVDVPALLARLRALSDADARAVAIALDREKRVPPFARKTQEEVDADSERGTGAMLVAMGLVTEDERQRAQE